ncbi:MAG: hypothetical protein Q9198_005182, partial [Flavoplaca austrocitrina]
KRLAVEREKITLRETKKDNVAKKNNNKATRKGAAQRVSGVKANKKPKALTKEQLYAKKRKEIALNIKVADLEEREAALAKRRAATAEKARKTAGNDAQATRRSKRTQAAGRKVLQTASNGTEPKDAAMPGRGRPAKGIKRACTVPLMQATLGPNQSTHKLGSLTIVKPSLKRTRDINRPEQGLSDPRPRRQRVPQEEISQSDPGQLYEGISLEDLSLGGDMEIRHLGLIDGQPPRKKQRFSLSTTRVATSLKTSPDQDDFDANNVQDPAGTKLCPQIIDNDKDPNSPLKDGMTPRKPQDALGSGRKDHYIADVRQPSTANLMPPLDSRLQKPRTEAEAFEIQKARK